MQLSGDENLTALDGINGPPPSLSRSRSLSRPFVARDDARCTTTRSRRRTRTYARTHGYFHATRGRDATSVRTTTSTSPPYAFVAAIFFGDTVAIRESRNVKRTRVHGCKCARALRACERNWRHPAPHRDTSFVSGCVRLACCVFRARAPRRDVPSAKAGFFLSSAGEYYIVYLRIR